MRTLQSLPVELHIKIFKNLSQRKSVLSLILSCKQLYLSFTGIQLEELLESIRYTELGCGVYADALIHSYCLMEPGIGVEHVKSFTDCFHTAMKNETDDHKGIWASFLASLPKDSWRSIEEYSPTSFCYLNRMDSYITAKNRWSINYRLVRLLARQCCISGLSQLERRDNDDRSGVTQRRHPPPTEREIRRFENGTYAFWIMANIAALIHRPDFLVSISLNQRIPAQRQLRRNLISAFNVWDWRVAMSIRDHMTTALNHLNNDNCLHFLKTPPSRTCMWAGLPEGDLTHDNDTEISDTIMASFSPPGAMRFFSPLTIVANRDELLTQGHGGEVVRDSKKLKQFISNIDIHSQSELCHLRSATSGFADMEPFFWRMVYIQGVWPEDQENLDDIYTFYPREKYPNREKLPLETPRALLEVQGIVRYGTKEFKYGARKVLMDDGWAWKSLDIDWDMSMWDDWRLKQYANYFRPKKRARKPPAKTRFTAR